MEHAFKRSLFILTTSFQLYEDIFEKPFLTATGDYYREEAQNLLQEGSISLYMQRVIQKIESENMRSRKFLYPGSYQKVIFVAVDHPLFGEES